MRSAFAMTVPPPVIAANRAELMALVATNFLGQNTPAIAATEAQYGESLPRRRRHVRLCRFLGDRLDVNAVHPPAADHQPGGLAGQAVAVGQAAGTSAGHVQAIMSTGQLMSAAPQALQGLASPLASTAHTGQERSRARYRTPRFLRFPISPRRWRRRSASVQTGASSAVFGALVLWV